MNSFVIGLLFCIIITPIIYFIWFKDAPKSKPPFIVHLYGRIMLQYAFAYGAYLCYTSGNWFLYIFGTVLVLFFITHILLVFQREELEEALNEYMMEKLSK